MPSLLQIEDFEPYLDKTLRMEASNSAFDIQLVEMKTLKAVEGAPRKGFSLLFKDPKNNSFPQGTYKTKLDHMDDPILLFMVPVVSSDDGTYLEAIFN